MKLGLHKLTIDFFQDLIKKGTVVLILRTEPRSDLHKDLWYTSFIDLTTLIKYDAIMLSHEMKAL
jgi:hypothetical protein